MPEGSILPIGPEMQWSDEKPADTIHLYVYAGKNASFLLYEDEGTNYNYEKGKYTTIDIEYNDKNKTIFFSNRKGSFNGMLKKRHFNIILITKDTPCPINIEAPQEGVKTEYTGKEKMLYLESL